MTEAAAIAAHLNRAPRAGALCFWGQWFGRPLDNLHQTVSCEADGDLLTVRFKGGETLIVRSPRAWAAEGRAFRISDAAMVLWEWPVAGRGRGRWQFERQGDAIVASANIVMSAVPLRGDADRPAVEMY